MHHQLDLLRVLVGKELQVRYKGSLLGYLWSVLHPLAFAAVFYVVFQHIVRLEVEHYAVVLITALFPWQWLQNSINASPMWFIENAPLIKKVRFPRWTLVLAGALTDALHFVFALPVIVFFLVLEGFPVHLSWLPLLPLLLVAQLLVVFGISLVVASANLFLRDLERLTSVLTLLWFYATPVLFPIDRIPEAWRPLIAGNPAGALVTCWRSFFLEGAVPAGALAVAFAWGFALVGVGALVYRSLQWRFAEVV
jgi:lipopolysaccharide transport system permease protein